MKVWVVTGDVYEWKYGAEIEIFGVYDSEEKAKDRKKDSRR